jgi:hypothetical protein
MRPLLFYKIRNNEKELHMKKTDENNITHEDMENITSNIRDENNIWAIIVLLLFAMPSRGKENDDVKTDVAELKGKMSIIEKII